MNRKAYYWLLLVPLVFFVLWFFVGRSSDNNVQRNNTGGTICVVLAHPDDETIMGGTLAMLGARGFDITVVYVTSGDDGPDETGRGLHGDALGEVREEEALQALQAIGIKNAPVFLRYPDSHVPEHVEAVQHALYDLFNEINPQVVFGFGPDGITDDWDHKMTGFATDSAFDLTDSGRLLLHMAVTKPLAPFFASGVAVPRHSVNVRVDVAEYADQRARAVDAHHTQFNRRARSAYNMLVHTMRAEKFIIARNRGAGEWLERCFDIKDECEDSRSTDPDSTSTQ